jgi:hypothetical protein
MQCIQCAAVFLCLFILGVRKLLDEYKAGISVDALVVVGSLEREMKSPSGG